MTLYPIPKNQFDRLKFKARYSLADAQFVTDLIDGQLYLRLINVTIPDNPPVFEAPSLLTQEELTPPIHMKAGSAQTGAAPLTFSAGQLVTRLELGAFEFIDDGMNGGLYITQHVDGVLTRVRIA